MVPKVKEAVVTVDALAGRLASALGASYQLGGVLGRGGMGAVYRATDRRLRREVAIKVLPPELGYSGDLRARFVREAQMAAQLSHPNIVPIYDVGEQGDLVWFTMALVEGESARARVEREGSQPITVVRRVLQEVAQALAYAHAKGVIHRDIKPDNILIDRGSGRALVTDFGIAKALRELGADLPDVPAPVWSRQSGKPTPCAPAARNASTCSRRWRWGWRLRSNRPKRPNWTRRCGGRGNARARCAALSACWSP